MNNYVLEWGKEPTISLAEPISSDDCSPSQAESAQVMLSNRDLLVGQRSSVKVGGHLPVILIVLETCSISDDA